MSAIAGQMAGPNWLTFCKGTRDCSLFNSYNFFMEKIQLKIINFLRRNHRYLVYS